MEETLLSTQQLNLLEKDLIATQKKIGALEIEVQGMDQVTIAGIEMRLALLEGKVDTIIETLRKLLAPSEVKKQVVISRAKKQVP